MPCLATLNTRMNAFMPNDTVSLYVEKFCNDGCVSVRAIIAALEAGERPPEIQHLLSADERQALLTELKEVMAVYDRPERDC